jgi:hypothetical protein
VNAPQRIHPALAVLILLGATLAAWAVVCALVLAALVIGGTWGVVVLFVAGAAIARELA